MLRQPGYCNGTHEVRKGEWHDERATTESHVEAAGHSGGHHRRVRWRRVARNTRPAASRGGPVAVTHHQHTTSAAQATRVVLRPIGSTLPMGFLALFAGSLLLSAIQLRWIPLTQCHVVALAVLGFVAPLQAVTSVVGFLARDPVAGTGVGLLGATWATTGIVLLTRPPGSVSPGLGILLVVAAATLLVPAVVAAAGKVLAAIVIGSAAVRFALSGAYQLTSSPAWQHAAGIAGLVVAAVAGYGALAFEVESALGHAVLPVLRHDQGRQAVSGRLADQVADVAHEAGVRKQL